VVEGASAGKKGGVKEGGGGPMYKKLSGGRKYVSKPRPAPATILQPQVWEKKKK